VVSAEGIEPTTYCLHASQLNVICFSTCRFPSGLVVMGFVTKLTVKPKPTCHYGFMYGVAQM
jgi:hypothetical protein